MLPKGGRQASRCKHAPARPPPGCSRAWCAAWRRRCSTSWHSLLASRSTTPPPRCDWHQGMNEGAAIWRCQLARPSALPAGSLATASLPCCSPPQAGLVPEIAYAFQIRDSAPFNLTSFALSLLLVFRCLLAAAAGAAAALGHCVVLQTECMPPTSRLQTRLAMPACRTNASYSRWLDARKSWGTTVTRGRHVDAGLLVGLQAVVHPSTALRLTTACMAASDSPTTLWDAMQGPGPPSAHLPPPRRGAPAGRHLSLDSRLQPLPHVPPAQRRRRRGGAAVSCLHSALYTRVLQWGGGSEAAAVASL